jgi:hypothetical protein
MGWVEHVTCKRGMRNAYRILVRKAEEKSPLGRSRGRWENDIRRNVKQRVWEGVNWICLDQDRVQ